MELKELIKELKELKELKKDLNLTNEELKMIIFSKQTKTETKNRKRKIKVKKWTQEEIQQLINYVNMGLKPREISKRIIRYSNKKKNRRSIIDKINELKKEGKLKDHKVSKYKVSKYSRWTAQEIDKALRLKEMGLSVSEISKQIRKYDNEYKNRRAISNLFYNIKKKALERKNDKNE